MEIMRNIAYPRTNSHAPIQSTEASRRFEFYLFSVFICQCFHVYSLSIRQEQFYLEEILGIKH